MRIKIKKRFLIGIIVICVVILVFYFITRSIPEVEVAMVKRGTVLETIAEDGKTRLARKFIISMPIEGCLFRMDLEVGDNVEKGQVLAKIDDYELVQKINGLKAQLDEISAQIVGVDKAKPKPEEIKTAQLQMEASRLGLEKIGKDLEIARIDYEKQEIEYNRILELWKDKVVSDSSYDKANQLFKSAKEHLKQAEIQKKIAIKDLEMKEEIYKRVINSVNDNEYQREVFLAQRERIKSEINILEERILKTQIISPVKGPVIEKFIEDEQVLLAGTPLLVIGDISSLEVEVDILSEEIGKVRVGQDVRISGKGIGDNVLKGRVNTIYPAGFKKISSLGIEQQRVKTLISFDDNAVNIRPGVSVDVGIIIAQSSDTLRIPENAIFKYLDGWAVFIVKGNNVYIQKIQTGLSDTEYIEVKEGLEEGQLFVFLPSNELKPGMRIRPINKTL